MSDKIQVTPSIPRRCILAATSERGACVHCGTPWHRVVEATGGSIGKSYVDHSVDDEARGKVINTMVWDGTYQRSTTGWEPGCECAPHETRPSLVLDSFGGSGTTARVALELNGNYIYYSLQ